MSPPVTHMMNATLVHPLLVKSLSVTRSYMDPKERRAIQTLCVRTIQEKARFTVRPEMIRWQEWDAPLPVKAHRRVPRVVAPVLPPQEGKASRRANEALPYHPAPFLKKYGA